MAALDVDDAQPPRAERDARVRVEVHAAVVGPAVDHERVHRLDRRGRGGGRQAADAAHGCGGLRNSESGTVSESSCRFRRTAARARRPARSGAPPASRCCAWRASRRRRARRRGLPRSSTASPITRPIRAMRRRGAPRSSTRRRRGRASCASPSAGSTSRLRSRRPTRTPPIPAGRATSGMTSTRSSRTSSLPGSSRSCPSPPRPPGRRAPTGPRWATTRRPAHGARIPARTASSRRPPRPVSPAASPTRRGWEWCCRGSATGRPGTSPTSPTSSHRSGPPWTAGWCRQARSTTAC